MKSLMGWVFLMGFSLGNLCHHLRKSTWATPKYIVGDCLSNGLYLEKVIEIREHTLFNAALYVTIPIWPNGKKGIPDTTKTWIVDNNYVKINNLNYGK